ncbi:MAG: phage virion morphogenesis protein [Deltaproteobacteria bacterium]|nr:phage virion morphogenesis protein [Deltaproteobacteria bacterium]MCL4873115.1 phage virion morphogenesis protein [bacterium]
MDINIKMELDGVRDLFRRLKKAGGDFTPVMKVIGETVKTSVKRNFLEGGRPGKWTPLSPETLKRKRNKGRVLIEESHLMASVNWRATPRSVEVGTNKVYAAIHQFGFDGTVRITAHRRKVKSRDIKEGRKTIASGIGFVRDHERMMKVPARPFLMVQDEDIAEIRAAITAHIMAAEKGR